MTTLTSDLCLVELVGSKNGIPVRDTGRSMHKQAVITGTGTGTEVAPHGQAQAHDEGGATKS